ncbi:MAG: family 10 glycosylhydrolase [Candidatus Sumerlaeaceae bacterium]
MSSGKLGCAVTACLLMQSVALGQTPVTTVLENFEGGGTHAASAVTATNSSSGGASNSTFANVTEGGSKRLKMTDVDGTYNGGYMVFTGAIPQAGYYLFTGDVKVDNPSSLSTFGVAIAPGAPSSAKVSDLNAGYVMNLAGTGDAALGYQTIGAAINVPAGGTFPRDLIFYFGTDPSGNGYNASAYDGNYNGGHRNGTATWAASSANAVYLDNIKRIGPGKFGEERHLWISVYDNMTNLTNLENLLVQAKNNNFNCVDILARYRANAFYVPNRSNSTYPNPEPFASSGGKSASASNDPIQYAIDRGHELGLKVFVSFGCFLVSDTSSYPSYVPSGSIMHYYNGGAPRAMLTGDPSAEGLWADPSRADVRNYTRNVLMDFVSNYDVDGVIFDRIRYPSSQYSYNPTGLAEMGISGTPAPTDAAFREARKNAITTFLGSAYEAATTLKPWLIVGTVPIAYASDLGSTYNSVFQFWPKWQSRKTSNRVVSFGCCDLYQPQFYRLWNSTGYEAPASNTTLMNKAQYGDIAAYNLDFGLMPGALSGLAPLFYHPNTGDVNQSNANAQNITDGRGLAMTGFGLFKASETLTDISYIRQPGASSAGVDVLGTGAAQPDYLFKAGYDNLKPNAVTNFAAAPQADGTVNLTWTAPAVASDGDGAANYLLYRTQTSPVKEYWSNLLTQQTIAGSSTSYLVPTDYAGTYYYKIVTVDNYNNHSTAVQIGPYTVSGEPAPPADVIVDNPATVITGTWSSASSAADKYGADYRYKGPGTGSAAVAFNASLPTTGLWNVYEWHSVGSNRATNARHTITRSGGSDLVTVNQTLNGGKWNLLGQYSFNGSTGYSATIDDNFSGTVVIADAIRWEYVVQAPAAPANLSAFRVSGTQVNLNWTDNASNERNYLVGRATSAGGPFTDVAALGINVTSWSDTGLNAGTVYYYQVRAQNSGGTSAASNTATAPTMPADVIVDNTDAGFTKSTNWIYGTSATDKYGADYWYRSTASVSDAATWNYSVPQTRNYEIYAWWSQGTNRSTTAPYIAYHGGGSTTVYKNQQTGGGAWQSLGTFSLNAGTNQVKLSCWTAAGFFVIADAVKIVAR